MKITSKQCAKCESVKPVDEFYRDKRRPSGRQSWCINCKKEWYKSNPTYYSNYAHQNAERVRSYKQKYDEKVKPTRKEYYLQNRDKILIRMREYANNNREKTRARSALGYAVRTGKLSKPELCSYCKSDNQIEGHHMDYSRPLDVIWLCISCHKAETYGFKR